MVADGACLTQAWRQEATTWDGFVAKLDDVADHKECGGYVLGDFGGNGRRLRARCLSRWALALDYDGAADDLIDRLRATGYRAAWYSSYSHRQPGKGLRYRVIVPLSRVVESQDEYADAVAGLLEQIGADGLDEHSFQVEHLMFWPSAADPALHEYGSQEGQLADTDDLLVDGALSVHRSVRASEYDGPSYDGPDYDHLSPERQRQARETVQRALDKWRRAYTEAAEWPEGQEDDEGRGWEGLAKAGAFRLAKLAVHPAFPLTGHEAQTEYEAMVKPIEHGDGCKGKWKYALAKAARQPVAPPEWADTPEDVFEPVEDDSDVSEDDWGPTEQRFYREMVARDRAQRRFAREQSPDVGSTGRTMDGGEFLLDIPAVPESVWGVGKRMIWSKGEALMLVGPPGVGKTTLAGQVVRARVAGGDVLGVPVTPTDSRVLYLAMDRPEQIRRALNRNMHDLPRGVLSDRIRFWRGPLARDLAEDPHHLLMLAREHGADTIVVDSLKDAVRGVQEDRPAAAYNTARQHCLAEGVEVLELHHLVKRGVDGKPPTDIQGVYGSAWLTAGAGSVVLLWGQPGDPIVEWTHLKQPMEEIGPFKVVHDHGAGQSEVHKPIDPVAMAEDAGAEGVTARSVAQAWFGVTKPSDAQLEKARRLLTKLADQDRLVRIEGTPVTWRAAGGFDVL